MLVRRIDMTPDLWINTTGLPPDGREHYRQLPRFGNGHAVFEQGAEYGEIHHDQYNAIDFPGGTINHLARYANEHTGVHEGLARIVITGGGLYAIYRLLNAFSR